MLQNWPEMVPWSPWKIELKCVTIVDFQLLEGSGAVTLSDLFLEGFWRAFLERTRRKCVPGGSPKGSQNWLKIDVFIQVGPAGHLRRLGRDFWSFLTLFWMLLGALLGAFWLILGSFSCLFCVPLPVSFLSWFVQLLQKFSVAFCYCSPFLF